MKAPNKFSRPRAGRMALAALATLVAASSAHAQVGAPTDDDFKDAPPQFREALTGGKMKPDASELTRQNVKGAPPSSDPRDFNGMYNFLRQPGGRPGTPAGVPGAAPPPGGPPPGGAPPGGPPGAAPASRPSAGGQGGPGSRSTGARACTVSSFPGLTSYSTTILVNERTVIFLMEENHHLRWARFTDKHQANFTPSWSGDSIARWDGDTLVIDTVGIKVEGQSATDHVVERTRKLPDGNIEIQQFKVDAAGVETPSGKVTLRWRPDLTYVEDICEDLGEAFGVGYK